MTLEERLADLEARVKALEGLEAIPAAAKKKPVSLREFINKLQPENGIMTALVIGYFYESIQEVGYFNNELLKTGFADAKIIAPKNIPDVIAQMRKKAYIMPSSNPEAKGKAWVLTNTAEELIEQMIAND